MTKVNTFIVGAPKCGTTALFSYLSSHPEVSTPAEKHKEPHFFATDLPGYQLCKDLESYHELFAGATGSQQVLLEGSVFYLYSNCAIQNVWNYNPDAKLIAMLRNPVEMVHAMHAQLVFSRDEDELDFAKAWQLVAERKAGNCIPKYNRAVEVLFYDEIARYAEQLGRLLAIVPEEKFMLIFYDDFKKDTAGAFKAVLDFLELEPVETDLKPVNISKRQRFQWLANLTERPPEPLLNAYLSLKKRLGLEGKELNLRAPVIKMNVVTAPREPLPEEVESWIIEAYRDDIERLATLTRRNLDHWLKVS